VHEIKRLEQHVINQIAAGEVVERPASVLKELIENSIDADATHIEVSITEGGLTKIEVKDNGKGIGLEDLPLAFERYTTSKLVTTSDLDSISTYGFRGEALAAISSVSKATIVSRHNDEVNQIASENGVVSKITPGSRAQGTTVTIEHLFSQVPARLKFMKTPETEYRYILGIFQHFALLNGSIHFVLHNNGKQIYNFPPSATRLFPIERVAKVYAVSESDLVAVEHEEYGIKVVGYVLHPKLLSGTSKFFAPFINQRPVEDKAIFKATQQGITGFVPDFFKSSAVISVTLPSEQVDVNVHPRKTEVKLLNPFRVYAAVTHAVSQALQAKIAAPDRQFSENLTERSSNAAKSPFSSWDKKQDIAYDRLRGSGSQFYFDAPAPDSHGSSTYSVVSALHSTDGAVADDSVPRIPQYLLEQARSNSKNADIVPILGR